MTKSDFFTIVVLFYAGWFGSIYLAQIDQPVASLIFPALMISYLIFRKSLNKKSLYVAGAIALVGVLFDLALLYSGFITAVGQTIVLIPIWLISLWLLFSFSMIKIGQEIRPPVWLAALLGFIMGPLTYKSGEAFNVLTFSDSSTFIIYAVFWTFLFPIVLILSKRYR